jgi:hypothetical protein
MEALRLVSSLPRASPIMVEYSGMKGSFIKAFGREHLSRVPFRVSLVLFSRGLRVLVSPMLIDSCRLCLGSSKPLWSSLKTRVSCTPHSTAKTGQSIPQKSSSTRTHGKNSSHMCIHCTSKTIVKHIQYSPHKPCHPHLRRAQGPPPPQVQR